MSDSIKAIERQLFEERRDTCGDLDARFRFLLDCEKKPRGYWEGMEVNTGISAQSWRSAFNNRQRPSIEMIESLARRFPEHAFWLIYGALPPSEMRHCFPAHK